MAAAALAVALLGACGDDAPSGQLDVEFEMEKDCVRAGEKQTIVTTADDDGIEVAYPVIYADGKFHHEEARGHTDEDGVFKATFEIPDDAPAGTATAKIIAAKGSRSDTADAPFHVATDASPCP